MTIDLLPLREVCALPNCFCQLERNSETFVENATRHHTHESGSQSIKLLRGAGNVDMDDTDHRTAKQLFTT